MSRAEALTEGLRAGVPLLEKAESSFPALAEILNSARVSGTAVDSGKVGDIVRDLNVKRGLLVNTPQSQLLGIEVRSSQRAFGSDFAEVGYRLQRADGNPIDFKHVREGREINNIAHEIVLHPSSRFSAVRYFGPGVSAQSESSEVLNRLAASGLEVKPYFPIAQSYNGHIATIFPKVLDAAEFSGRPNEMLHFGARWPGLENGAVELTIRGLPKGPDALRGMGRVDVYAFKEANPGPLPELQIVKNNI